MKIIKNLLATAFFASIIVILAASCSNDDDNDGNTSTVIEFDALPENAKTFLTTHFPTIESRMIKQNAMADDDGSIYDVYLNNGFEIDFDINGNWTDVDGNTQAVPTAIVPETITNYVTANYVGQTINTIEIERTGYDIELSNGLDLVFDNQGQFIRVDN
ncbi:PepSY-like domain-containing protein [Flavobacterium microcysteis]